MFRSSPPEVFSNKGTVQIRSEPTGEQTRRSAILTKLLCNFIEIKPTHGCTPGNSHHTRKTPLPRRTHLCCCCCCCCCCYFFSFFFPFFSFHFPTTYISLVITLLLLLLQLCLLILPLWVFLGNQVGESSKQGIQAACSTPIDHIK